MTQRAAYRRRKSTTSAVQWIVTVHDYAAGEDAYFGPYRSGQEAESAAAELLTVVYEHHQSPDDVTVAFAPLREPGGVREWLT